MTHTQEYQETKRLQNRISSFMENFKFGTLLSGSGIRKLRGAKPLAVFATIFSLPFSGVNFSRGIVNNPELEFRKDAAYEFLKNPRYNWRKFLLGLVTVVARFMDVLTSEQREKVLIIDDSTYDRSRSKVVELLAWVHDHNANRSLKGFKLMTLGWSDGVSFLPLDFILCSSSKASKRLQGIRKELDKRCCGYKRRLEAMAKSTEHLESMVKRALALGILSTKIDLADEEIVRIYGKPWDIEVFFKMMKHYLNLEREAQLRDYDGIIGHITIVMSRYVFLAFEQRCHDDPRTLGSLFYACSEERQDLSLVEARGYAAVAQPGLGQSQGCRHHR